MSKVLIIDDAEFARMVLRSMLRDKGYEVCGEAENGADGVAMFKELRPDVTICDIRMHGMSGLDCIRQILSEDANAKVLVCAAIDSEEKIDDAKKLGVKGIIRKPVHIDELTREVENALNESDEPVNYKKVMEQRAMAEDIKINSLLDFFAAFQSINGFALDDPRADEQFLKENCTSMLIGMRALLSAKVPLPRLNKLERIFEEMIDS